MACGSLKVGDQQAGYQGHGVRLFEGRVLLLQTPVCGYQIG